MTVSRTVTDTATRTTKRLVLTFGDGEETSVPEVDSPISVKFNSKALDVTIQETDKLALMPYLTPSTIDIPLVPLSSPEDSATVQETDGGAGAVDPVQPSPEPVSEGPTVPTAEQAAVPTEILGDATAEPTAVPTAEPTAVPTATSPLPPPEATGVAPGRRLLQRGQTVSEDTYVPDPAACDQVPFDQVPAIGDGLDSQTAEVSWNVSFTMPGVYVICLDSGGGLVLPAPLVVSGVLKAKSHPLVFVSRCCLHMPTCRSVG